MFWSWVKVLMINSLKAYKWESKLVEKKTRSKYNWVSRAQHVLFVLLVLYYLSLDSEFKFRRPSSYLVWPALQLLINIHQIISTLIPVICPWMKHILESWKHQSAENPSFPLAGSVCGKSASTLKADASFSLDFGKWLQLLSIRSGDALFRFIGTAIVLSVFSLQFC